MENFIKFVSFVKHMNENEFLRELFDKKLIKILEQFIQNKNKEFYLRELSQLSKVSPASTYRIVKKLSKLGIIDKIKIKRFKFYKLARNQRTELLEELFKADPLQEFIERVKSSINKVKGNEIRKIILYGEKAENKADLLIIGDIEDKTEIEKAAEEINNKYNFEVVFLTFNEEQFKKMTEMGLYSREKKVLWKSI